MFGKTNIDPEKDDFKGPYGRRFAKWVVKYGDLNEYRLLTPEEDNILISLLEQYYYGKTEKIKMLAYLESDLSEKHISIDEFTKRKKELGFDFFSQVVKKFRDKTGLTIVKAQQYEIDSRYKIYAF